MKELLENKIKINSIPRPRTTIFDSIEDRDVRYFDITRLKGKSISISYIYIENNIEREDSILIYIPSELETEGDIKQFILDEINNKLTL